MISDCSLTSMVLFNNSKIIIYLISLWDLTTWSMSYLLDVYDALRTNTAATAAAVPHLPICMVCFATTASTRYAGHDCEAKSNQYEALSEILIGYFRELEDDFPVWTWSQQLRDSKGSSSAAQIAWLDGQTSLRAYQRIWNWVTGITAEVRVCCS